MASKTLRFSASQIDQAASQPLYEQIYDLLRARIDDGTLGLNDRLPAEQDLIDQLGVSRITVKRAMNELAASGLVRRQRGIGTVVIHDASAPVLKGSFETMMDGLTRMGTDTDVQLIACTTAIASPKIITSLALSHGDKVQRIVRVRSMDNRPFSYLETYIPARIAAKYDQEKLASAALIDLLDQAGFTPVEAEQSISAVTAEPEIAKHLGIAPGSALLRVHRVMSDASGTPVQDITVHYRADRFEYHMRLSRNTGSATDWETS